MLVHFYQYSFFMLVVRWGKLPADLVLVTEFDSFKIGFSKINHEHLTYKACGKNECFGKQIVRLYMLSIAVHSRINVWGDS